MKYIIFDWYGHICFDGREFNSKDDAEAFLCLQADNDYEFNRDDYRIDRKE